MPEIELLRDDRIQHQELLARKSMDEARTYIDADDLEGAGDAINRATQQRRKIEIINQLFGPFLPKFQAFREALNELNEGLSSKSIEPVFPDSLVRYLEKEADEPLSEPEVFHPQFHPSVERTGEEAASAIAQPELVEIVLPEIPEAKEDLGSGENANEMRFPSSQDLGANFTEQIEKTYELLRARSEGGLDTSIQQLAIYFESLGYSGTSGAAAEAVRRLKYQLGKSKLGVKLVNIELRWGKPAKYQLSHSQIIAKEGNETAEELSFEITP